MHVMLTTSLHWKIKNVECQLKARELAFLLLPWPAQTEVACTSGETLREALEEMRPLAWLVF